jgi:allantoin racemase
VSTLLLINPNTSESVTALLRAHAEAAAPAGGRVFAVTAQFGARYISSELSAAVAAHAVLDAYAHHVAAHGEPGAVLIGCFGDPGLLALRELTAVPVLGLAEASMRAAGAAGSYAIVTGGVFWPAMLRRLAWSLGLLEPLAGIVTVERSGAELAADPPAAHRLLLAACRQALAGHAPQGLLLGGAALAGMADALRPHLPVPMWDSVACGVQAAWRAAAQEAISAGSPSPATSWTGLPEPLSGLLAARSNRVGESPGRHPAGT